MTKQRDTLVAWLNDAYAMERNLHQSLQQQIARAEDYPAIKAQLQAHLAQTRDHENIVQECLESLGERASTTKGLTGAAAGFASAMMNSLADDSIVKNLLTNYSMEHLEIASYRSLIEAANLLGEQQVATACTAILKQEQDMAAWIERELPHIIRTHLAQPV